MDIEIIPTQDKPITGIRKRLILADLQKVNPDYGKLLSLFMNKDKKKFYDDKQLLIDLIEKTIEVAFIEGQRTGTTHTQFIGVKDEKRSEQVYPEATGTGTGSLKD